MSQSPAPYKIPVLLPLSVDIPFDYESPSPLRPGTLVKVSFRKQEAYGVVWPTAEEPLVSKQKRILSYKPILQVLDPWHLPEESLRFIEWVRSYTLAPRGQILKMVLPLPESFDSLPSAPKASSLHPPLSPTLSPDQKAAACILEESIQENTFHPFLLEGVTGSGKTEVYFEALDFALKKKAQSLVLLPEIALSTQWLERFEHRFGFRPGIWHSELSPQQRKETLKNLLKGDISVLVGTRSALFLPFQNLKLLIVDEEHDGSYKQEEGVIYNARDMAIVRTHLGKATCVLVSATPSLETETNVATGKYSHLFLPSRYGGASLPELTLIDMRQQKLAPQTWLSLPLRQALEETLLRGEQAMLFLNRRGYAPLTLCRECGDRLMCPQCSISLVEHKTHESLLCHYCGYTQTLPSRCSLCDAEDAYRAIGPGVERVLEEVETFLPQARCGLFTSDYLTTPKKLAQSLAKIENHEIDILIGTQIMAKGHHFPLLTLVGIVDGDSALSGNDLRAAEKSFQILHQVAGRSGRALKKGRVLLQTYLPEHPLMQALYHQDRKEFLALETEQRALHGFPPYGRLVALILSGRNQIEVEKTARLLAKKFPLSETSELLGPTPAPLSYLRGKHRWRLLLKTRKESLPQPLLKTWLSSVVLPSSIKLKIDIDPYSFF